jgi:copper chaperone NosL
MVSKKDASLSDGTMMIFSTGALVDFYQWEYRYGHELSDDAPIKMEGQYYQPPLLGKKVIMNIEAFSMPAIGGLGHIAAIFLAIAALFTEWRRRKGIQIDMKSLTLCFLLSTSASLLGCSSSGPKSIDYGGDHCDECRMVISDKRFGGELVTEKGKAFKFDSLECLLRFNDQHAGEKMTAYVVNSSLPNQFVKAQEAAFLYDKKLRSPMGKGILSGPNPTSLQQFIRPNDPASEQESIATWPAVVDLLSTNEVTATSK